MWRHCNETSISFTENQRVVIMPTLSSLVAPYVVLTTTYGATGDDKSDIMTTLGFQWCLISCLSTPRTAEQIVSSIIDDGIRPRISFLYNIELRELMRECWAPSPKDRPMFRRVHKVRTNHLIKISNWNRNAIVTKILALSVPLRIQCTGYDNTTSNMDCMDLDKRCPRKAVSLIHSLAHELTVIGDAMTPIWHHCGIFPMMIDSPTL